MTLMVGGGKPSPQLLKKLGVPKRLHDLVSTAYQVGKLEKTLVDIDWNNLDLPEFEKALSKATMTSAQKKALEFAKVNAGQRITALNNTMTTMVTNVLTQQSMSQLQGIQYIIGQGLSTAQSRGEVARILRDFTGDWKRDWNRVAHSEMWEAKLQGEVMSILDNESPLTQDGGDTIVFKRPAHNACNQCKKHYLESDGVTPKLFRLQDLIANGSNVGRKTADWLPTVGILHPNCMCTLNIMPEGFTFDSMGQIVPE